MDLVDQADLEVLEVLAVQVALPDLAVLQVMVDTEAVAAAELLEEHLLLILVVEAAAPEYLADLLMLNQAVPITVVVAPEATVIVQVCMQTALISPAQLRTAHQVAEVD